MKLCTPAEAKIFLKIAQPTLERFCLDVILIKPKLDEWWIDFRELSPKTKPSKKIIVSLTILYFGFGKDTQTIQFTNE